MDQQGESHGAAVGTREPEGSNMSGLTPPPTCCFVLVPSVPCPSRGTTGVSVCPPEQGKHNQDPQCTSPVLSTGGREWGQWAGGSVRSLLCRDRYPVLGIPESPQCPPWQCPHLIQRASKVRVALRGDGLGAQGVAVPPALPALCQSHPHAAVPTQCSLWGWYWVRGSSALPSALAAALHSALPGRRC